MKKLALYSRIVPGWLLAILAGGSVPFSPSELVEIQKVRLCEGESINLTASADSATDFLWFRNGQPVAGGDRVEVEITISGIYEVMSVNEVNCTSELSDPVEVIFLPAPDLKLSMPVVICDGSAVDLTKSIIDFDPNVFNYYFETPEGESLEMEEIKSISSSGTFMVKSNYKDLDCPSTFQKLHVTIVEEPVQALFDYKLSGYGEKGLVLAKDPIEFTNLSMGTELTYLWDFGDGKTSTSKQPKHQYDREGSYVVNLTVTDAVGCESIMEMRIEVNEAYLIMIPSGFTPLENENTTFRPKMRGIAAYEMYIFNTWGDLLYEMKSMEDPGWDGKIKGKLGPNGNYVYRANFTTIDGKKVDKSGVFTLIR